MCHGRIRAEPLVFAYIFAVLVHHDTAVGRQYGLRHGKQPVGVFSHRSVHVVHFLGYLQNSCSRAESAVLLVCFWNMSRSLPTSIPLVCMKRASGKRTALIRSAWFTRYSRTNLFPAVSATPLEVTKASRPPSESSSIALTKSSCEWSLWPVRRYRPFPQVGIEDTEVAERNV